MNVVISYPSVGALFDSFQVAVLQHSLWSLAVSTGQKE